MYCYHLYRVLPLSGAGQCCPNMPIMTLPACISPHRTQVFHLVITSSLIHASDWLMITTLTSDWLIAQDMIRRPIAGYLNQIADNWCRCRVSRSVWWLWWWLWSHQGAVPAPGPSWSSYSWDLLHQDEGFAESWRRKIKLVLLSLPLCMTHSRSLFSWKQFVLCSILQCCSLCRMLHRKWLMAGWRLFTLRMRPADQLLSPGRAIKPQQCHGVKRLIKVTILQRRSSHSHWILHGAVSPQIIRR